jgi:glycosyltransferase involved in cell wall biosynthesis
LRFDTHQLQWLDLPNVHFLGHKPVELLPRYIAASQVCLMPYKINEWTRHIDPLKMYEYLAAGKPVVSTDIPSARGFAPPLHLAHDAGSFLQAVELALQQANEAQSETARRLAASNSWDHRVQQISALLEETLVRTEAAACR